MSKKSKIIFGYAAIVLALAAAGAHYFYRANTAPQELEGTTPIAPGVQSGLASDLTPASLSYSQAATIFDKNRMEFNEHCRILPDKMTVDNGTTIMFDNHSRDALTFALDGIRYTLPGYGFKLFALKTSQTPHSVKVDCGPGQLQGTIELR